MSELKKKINETALNELMVSIRRNAKDSACIKNFEDLLHEIDDPEFVNITVNSMTNFMSEWFELLGAAVIVPQKKFRSKMLTSQFIEPLRFFGRVKKMADEQMKKRAIIEEIEIDRAVRVYWRTEHRDNSSLKRSPITVDTERKRINVASGEVVKYINDNATFRPAAEIFGSYCCWTMDNIANMSDEDYEKLLPGNKNVKELARKEMLVWNYIPGVIKAVIQTKRREMNMDNNSKRF